MATTTENATKARPPARRLTLAEYDAMVGDGRLGPDDRVELLDGLVVDKMTKGLRHVAVTHRLFVTLVRSLPAAWHCRKEDPVELPAGPGDNAPSRPEPDVSVLKGRHGTFDARFPLPDDLALAVEVASSPEMLARDRAGLARYAWNGVRCVWIVNLAADVIEIYTEPSGPGESPVYDRIDVRHPGEMIHVSLPDGAMIALDVSELIA